MTINFDDAARAAWEDVVQEGETNWVALGYTSQKEVEMVASGTDSLRGARAHLETADQINYVGVRVYGYNKAREERRTKFVIISYVPTSVSGFKKARASVHKQAVMKFWRWQHVTLEANSIGQVSDDEIRQRLEHSCGSHKPEIWEWGGPGTGGEEDDGTATAAPAVASGGFDDYAAPADEAPVDDPPADETYDDGGYDEGGYDEEDY